MSFFEQLLTVTITNPPFFSPPSLPGSSEMEFATLPELHGHSWIKRLLDVYGVGVGGRTSMLINIGNIPMKSVEFLQKFDDVQCLPEHLSPLQREDY